MEEFFKNLQFVNIGWQIITPLIFMVADVITGYLQAIINKNVDSSIMRKGLMHKIMLILIIILGFVIHFAFNFSSISIAICLYIVVMECSSILENLKKAGIELKILEFFNKEVEEDEKK